MSYDPTFKQVGELKIEENSRNLDIVDMDDLGKEFIEFKKPITTKSGIAGSLA
jgi:hypothetical protein